MSGDSKGRYSQPTIPVTSTGTDSKKVTWDRGSIDHGVVFLFSCCQPPLPAMATLVLFHFYEIALREDIVTVSLHDESFITTTTLPGDDRL